MNASMSGRKVAVLNYSGNVGKSTLARHLLQPRMGGCPITFIESINEGGDSTSVKGRDFAPVMIEVLAAEEAIVDIGSSNIETVFDKAERMGDVLDAFDFFLIPTVSRTKQQADTVKVIKDLLSLGVSDSKLRVVFNNVDRDDDLDKQFGVVKGALDKLRIPYAVVFESDGFQYLKERSVEECIAEDRDFRAEIKEASDPEERRAKASALVVSQLAKGIRSNLDSVFQKLFVAAK